MAQANLIVTSWCLSNQYGAGEYDSQETTYFFSYMLQDPYVRHTAKSPLHPPQNFNQTKSLSTTSSFRGVKYLFYAPIFFQPSTLTFTPPGKSPNL
jgi:hypothetical protein